MDLLFQEYQQALETSVESLAERNAEMIIATLQRMPPFGVIGLSNPNTPFATPNWLVHHRISKGRED
jgi:hypothetical protein